MFYEHARDVYLGDRRNIDFTIEQMVAMAGDVSAQIELTRRVREEQNDPQFRELLVLYLEKAADELDEVAGAVDDTIDLLDRAALAPAVAVTTGAIAAIIATQAALAPLIVLFLGAVSIGVLGVGRTGLKATGRQRKSGAKRLRSLADRLRVAP
ncbi:MAG TPA: hypothetical protein VGG29_04650 [Caulobacteraceae bacterium]